jgi:4-hydroxybenzoate polyprenyltransferase
MDYKADARHPGKRTRPVASGAISPAAAMAFGGVLILLAAAFSSWLLPRAATLILTIYFVMMLAYSLGLKRRMILDVILIAIGFVLRASAGAEAVEAVISPWLIICTFMICMFLGFGKRRCELATFANVEEAREHRPTLLRYTPELLNHLISVTAGIAIITFVQYTMDDNPARMPPFPKEHLLYTLPLVAYGVFRYAMLIESGRLHGPTEILLHDRPFLATVVVWGAIAIFVVYERRIFAMLGWGG